VVVAASCGIEPGKVLNYKALLDSALELSASQHQVERCIILQVRSFVHSFIRSLALLRQCDEHWIPTIEIQSM